MRAGIGLTYLLLFLTSICQGQLYLADQAVLEIKKDALLQVNNADIENSGNIYNGGTIDLNGDLLNSDLLDCQPTNQSVIEVSGDWVNNGTFNSSTGEVLLDGAVQVLGGTGANNFYDLTSKGALADYKQLLADVEVSNQLDIGKNRLDIGDFNLVLRNPSLPVSETGGFLHTTFSGRVILNSASANIIPYPVPFGYNPLSPIKRKLSLEQAPSGIYEMAFIEGDPSAYGMDGNSIFDSTCRILDDHFWFVSTSEQVPLAIETESSDDPFSRISNWTGASWDPRIIDKSGHSVSFQYLSTEMQAPEQKYLTFNSEKPFVTLDPDRDLLEGSQYTIGASYYLPDNSIILWTSDDQIDCDDCPNPVFTAVYPDILKVRVENDGCFSEDEIDLNVLIRKDVYMQNAFSPNGDGINESFNPVLLEFETIESFKIFNRWGEKIYDAPTAWDGTYRGLKVDPGVYVYELTVRRVYSPTREKVIHKEGTIQVLR